MTRKRLLQAVPMALFAAGMLSMGVATSSCATMDVSSHVERGADFTQYRTWEWGPADALPTGDPRLDANPFFKDHLEGAVEKALASNRLQRAAAGATPDLLIHYHANISQRFQVNEPDVNCSGNCQANVIEYEQGTIVIDVMDTKTNRLVWRGWAQDSVQDTLNNQDRMEKQIEEAVSKMFVRFPATH